MYTNILIPTDGSELSAKAVQHGVALAKRIGARVTALTALPPYRLLTTTSRCWEIRPTSIKHACGTSPVLLLAPSPERRKS